MSGAPGQVTVARAPLRISLGGGGTDLPSYYREHGGIAVSVTISRHVWMLLNTGFQERFRLRHTDSEQAESVDGVEHPILREALRRHWPPEPVELSSTSDVPPGTGLGSSGAYAVCCLRALASARGEEPTADELAERACELEIDVLGRRVGKQDQYAAAHGGLNVYEFLRDDRVEVRPLTVSAGTRDELGERLLLFYTGEARSASDMLAPQVEATLAGDERVAASLHETKRLAAESIAALEAGDVDRYGELADAAFEVKRERAPGTVTERAGELRAAALRGGARGAMLLGAGGGGFLLTVADDPAGVRTALAAIGAPELPFGLTDEGAATL